MADGYLGEIRMFGGTFAPANWQFCNGQILSVAENTVLYAVIGNTYGGVANDTFALPDMRGRLAMNIGQPTGFPNVALGEMGGAEAVALTPAQLPQHTHSLQVSADVGTVNVPAANSVLSAPGPAGTVLKFYAAPGSQTPASPNCTTLAGTSAAHENMQPYFALNFIICVAGVFPPQP